jgi:hypothetical protein
VLFVTLTNEYGFERYLAPQASMVLGRLKVGLSHSDVVVLPLDEASLYEGIRRSHFTGQAQRCARAG